MRILQHFDDSGRVSLLLAVLRLLWSKTGYDEVSRTECQPAIDGVFKCLASEDHTVSYPAALVVSLITVFRGWFCLIGKSFVTVGLGIDSAYMYILLRFARGLIIAGGLYSMQHTAMVHIDLVDRVELLFNFYTFLRYLPSPVFLPRSSCRLPPLLTKPWV